MLASPVGWKPPFGQIYKISCLKASFKCVISLNAISARVCDCKQGGGHEEACGQANMRTCEHADMRTFTNANTIVGADCIARAWAMDERCGLTFWSDSGRVTRGECAQSGGAAGPYTRLGGGRSAARQCAREG